MVLGHGSRAAGAAEALARVAARLARGLDCPVEPASLQFDRPTLAECCRRLVTRGVTRVIVAPYFLFNGNHIRQDIPEELEGLRREYGHVEFILTGGLGDDGRLADVLKQRVLESLPGGGEADAGPGVVRTNPIEAESFDIIDGLLQPDDGADPAYQVIRRVVHATGDPSLAADIHISPGAIDAALQALGKGASVLCDVNMVAAGIRPTAERLGIGVHCGVAAGETADLARSQGITRSAAAFRLFAGEGNGPANAGAMVAVGNAPTALFECLALQRQGLGQPSLVVGVPVGFVGAAESKQELADSGLPHITIPGNRGGSSIAVAVVNALFRLSTTENDREEDG